MKAYRGRRGTAPLINLDTRRIWVISFTHHPLTAGKELRYPH